ncbi:hypothetical protein B0I37DRAFT_357472 [Chaetomium sp. MPI-CAGE-AT-0009]|nr:hypothetical protein B0I37DRAFT_357472 [Chaetomium sp. MPI-CAGE-AT-0009]
MKSGLGVVVSSFLGLALHAGAQGGGTQNPFGAATNNALNGMESTGSQNPWASSGTGSGATNMESTGSQNPFGGSGSGTGGSGATNMESTGSQNPFGGSGSGTGGSGATNMESTGSQNPFGGSGSGTGSGATNMESTGNQNPFGGSGSGTGGSGPTNMESTGSQNPFGGSGSGSTTSGGSQNPFGGGSGTGSGSGSTTPGSCSCPPEGITTPTGPRLDQRGCPAVRAAAPTGQALTYANSPICPTGDGQLYQSPDGATFYIQCCTHGATTVIKTLVTADFGECMDECSKTDRCSSVKFLAHAESWSEPYHTCVLSEDGGYSSAACGGDVHSYAFVVDPPAIETPDSAGVLCSTECPFAHNQLYVSSVGESFRMDCGKRHGTQVIYRDRQPSLKTCMEACGRLLACHSVDYDVHRQICYYGKHQGEPTISATGFASAYSMGGVGACAACSGGRCPNDPDPSAPPLDDRPFPQDDHLANPTPPDMLCPQLNEQVKEIGGSRYWMTCGSATNCPPEDGVAYFGAAADQQRTLDECLQACSNTQGCNSINFLETDYTPGGRARCILRRCNPAPSGPGNHISGHKLRRRHLGTYKIDMCIAPGNFSTSVPLPASSLCLRGLI